MVCCINEQLLSLSSPKLCGRYLAGSLSPSLQPWPQGPLPRSLNAAAGYIGAALELLNNGTPCAGLFKDIPHVDITALFPLSQTLRNWCISVYPTACWSLHGITSFLLIPEFLKTLTQQPQATTSGGFRVWSKPRPHLRNSWNNPFSWGQKETTGTNGFNQVKFDSLLQMAVTSYLGLKLKTNSSTPPHVAPRDPCHAAKDEWGGTTVAPVSRFTKAGYTSSGFEVHFLSRNPPWASNPLMSYEHYCLEIGGDLQRRNSSLMRPVLIILASAKQFNKYGQRIVGTKGDDLTANGCTDIRHSCSFNDKQTQEWHCPYRYEISSPAWISLSRRLKRQYAYLEISAVSLLCSPLCLDYGEACRLETVHDACQRISALCAVSLAYHY